MWTVDSSQVQYGPTGRVLLYGSTYSVEQHIRQNRIKIGKMKWSINFILIKSFLRRCSVEAYLVMRDSNEIGEKTESKSKRCSITPNDRAVGCTVWVYYLLSRRLSRLYRPCKWAFVKRQKKAKNQVAPRRMQWVL